MFNASWRHGLLRSPVRLPPVIHLRPEHRRQLERLITTGKHPAATLVHARILLKADQGVGGPAWGDAAIAEALDCGLRTVERVGQRFVERGS